MYCDWTYLAFSAWLRSNLQLFFCSQFAFFFTSLMAFDYFSYEITGLTCCTENINEFKSGVRTYVSDCYHSRAPPQCQLAITPWWKTQNHQHFTILILGFLLLFGLSSSAFPILFIGPSFPNFLSKSPSSIILIFFYPMYIIFTTITIMVLEWTMLATKLHDPNLLVRYKFITSSILLFIIILIYKCTMLGHCLCRESWPVFSNLV